MATEALAISDIDAYYGDSHVLHGVSFSLQPGRLLGLLGRNGAGKTTCMATIMGFLKPRRGAISLYGEAVGGLPPDVIARQGICLVPQRNPVYTAKQVTDLDSLSNGRVDFGIGIGWLKRVADADSHRADVVEGAVLHHVVRNGSIQVGRRAVSRRSPVDAGDDLQTCSGCLPHRAGVECDVLRILVRDSGTDVVF